MTLLQFKEGSKLFYRSMLMKFQHKYATSSERKYLFRFFSINTEFNQLSTRQRKLKNYTHMSTIKSRLLLGFSNAISFFFTLVLAAFQDGSLPESLLLAF